jgi:hypothetical protein
LGLIPSGYSQNQSTPESKGRAAVPESQLEPEWSRRGYSGPGDFDLLWGRPTTWRNPRDLWELDRLLEYQEVLLQDWTVSLRD